MEKNGLEIKFNDDDENKINSKLFCGMRYLRVRHFWREREIECMQYNHGPCHFVVSFVFSCTGNSEGGTLRCVVLQQFLCS